MSRWSAWPAMAASSARCAVAGPTRMGRAGDGWRDNQWGPKGEQTGAPTNVSKQEGEKLTLIANKRPVNGTRQENLDRPPPLANPLRASDGMEIERDGHNGVGG